MLYPLPKGGRIYGDDLRPGDTIETKTGTVQVATVEGDRPLFRSLKTGNLLKRSPAFPVSSGTVAFETDSRTLLDLGLHMLGCGGSGGPAKDVVELAEPVFITYGGGVLLTYSDDGRAPIADSQNDPTDWWTLYLVLPAAGLSLHAPKITERYRELFGARHTEACASLLELLGGLDGGLTPAGVMFLTLIRSGAAVRNRDLFALVAAEAQPVAA